MDDMEEIRVIASSLRFPSGRKAIHSTTYDAAGWEPIDPARIAGLGHRDGAFSGVYFVACNGFIKIGCAFNVVARARVIWQGCPGMDVEPLGWFHDADSGLGSYRLEQALHQQFAHIRDRGEWFRDNGQIRAFVTERARPWPQQRRES